MSVEAKSRLTQQTRNNNYSQAQINCIHIATSDMKEHNTPQSEIKHQFVISAKLHMRSSKSADPLKLPSNRRKLSHPRLSRPITKPFEYCMHDGSSQ